MTDLGTVRRDGGLGAVRFERHYRATPEELWAAWTEPERIARWLGAEVVGGPIAAGGTFRLEWGPDPDSQVELVVHELRAPRLLEWQWTINGEPPTLLRVELAPAGDGGTLLVLDHRALPFTQFAGLSAGWHDFLDALGTGEPQDLFAELVPAYRDRVAALG